MITNILLLFLLLLLSHIITDHYYHPIILLSLELYNIDPENILVLMETNLPTPTTARVYVNLPEGIYIYNMYMLYIYN